MAIRPPSIRLSVAYLPNANLRWEKVEAWEAGFESNMFRNRLHVEGVYYKKNTKDLLAKVPGLSGTVPGIGNLGQIENKGVELSALGGIRLAIGGIMWEST